MEKTILTDADRFSRIVELCDGVANALAGVSLEQFAANEILRDAIAYRLAALGEECKRLSDAARAKHDLPWKQIIGMRDRLAQDYFGNASDIIYMTATTSLKPLRAACSPASKT